MRLPSPTRSARGSGASASTPRSDWSTARCRARPRPSLTGVTPELAFKVREALDAAGHEQVRIVASGGFDAERIERFEQTEAPVDSYGVGSALLRGDFDFTADVVMLDGRPAGKVGRELRPNPCLRDVG